MFKGERKKFRKDEKKRILIGLSILIPFAYFETTAEVQEDRARKVTEILIERGFEEPIEADTSKYNLFDSTVTIGVQECEGVKFVVDRNPLGSIALTTEDGAATMLLPEEVVDRCNEFQSP